MTQVRDNLSLKEGGSCFVVTGMNNFPTHTIPVGYLLKELEGGEFFEVFTHKHELSDLGRFNKLAVLNMENKKEYKPAPDAAGKIANVYITCENFCSTKLEFSDGTTTEIMLTKERVAGLSIAERFAAIMERAEKMIACNAANTPS